MRGMKTDTERLTLARQLTLAPLGCCVIASVVLAQAPVGPGRRAVRFVVNSPADRVDNALGDGKCATATAGECTLRAAIQEANAVGANAYLIVLPADTYKLDHKNDVPTGPPPRGAEEDAAVKGDLDIKGFVRIIGVGPGHGGTVVDGISADRIFDILPAADVTLMGMTIQNGCVGSPPPPPNHPCPPTASWEGGGGIRNAGTLRLVNVDVRLNRISSAKNGAGIQNHGPSEQSHAQLAVEHSYVVRNEATMAAGGGIANSWGDATITRTDLLANSALNHGGGVLNDSRSAKLVISESLVRENSANRGGGIFSGGVATVTNTTISDNRANFCEGAAIYDTQGATVVSSSTIAWSTFGQCPSQGALYVTDKLVMRNSIIAEQHGCITNPANPNAKVESKGSNIDQTDSCQLRGSNDQINTDPRLAPLAANGGPTFTHRLLPGSAALDGVRGLGGNDSPRTDQRGTPRPSGNSFDIGAFEDATATITSVEPRSLPLTGPRPLVRLKVTGTNFANGMRIMVTNPLPEPFGRSEVLPTTFLSQTELTADFRNMPGLRASGMMRVDVVDTTGRNLANPMFVYLFETGW
jgi:CSLREA domain-containing protein